MLTLDLIRLLVNFADMISAFGDISHITENANLQHIAQNLFIATMINVV